MEKVLEEVDQFIYLGCKDQTGHDRCRQSAMTKHAVLRKDKLSVFASQTTEVDSDHCSRGVFRSTTTTLELGAEIVKILCKLDICPQTTTLREITSLPHTSLATPHHPLNTCSLSKSWINKPLIAATVQSVIKATAEVPYQTKRETPVGYLVSIFEQHADGAIARHYERACRLEKTRSLPPW